MLEYKAKFIGVASLLLCVAFASEALTLGRIRGAALIGQPLNVVVPVQIGAGEDASATCFEADVFHADTRQDPSRVRVLVEPTSQAEALNIRILSSANIDEPMVTVYLRALCDQKTTRRYVLLADFPSDLGPAVVPSQIVSVPPVTAAPTATAAGSGSVLAATNSTAASGVATPEPVVQPKAPVKPKPRVVKKAVKKPVKKASVPKPTAEPPAAPVVSDAPSGQPRLTLDSPVILSNQIDALSSTPPLGPTAEAERDLLKIQTLESDVKALLALAAKNEASLLDLRSRLQVAESERLPYWMVYGLAALLLMCLAVIGLLLRRQRQEVSGDNNQWHASVAAATPIATSNPNAAQTPGKVVLPGELKPRQSVPVPSTSMAKVSAPAQGLAQSTVSQVDVSMIELSESGFEHLMQSGETPSAVSKSQPPKLVSSSAVPVVHDLNASSVFDVRQQAEFFVSLGQTDQAVRILERHIVDSHDPNPHVYLDLLAIFHSLSLKVDFRQFREDFNRLFNSLIPEFSSFKDEGQALEAYPAALEAISAAWPSAKVLGVIESLVFRDSREAGSLTFDLAAFRDLLLLHAVAQKILLLSPDIEASGSGAVSRAVAETQTNPKPDFAGLALDMPLPMPSPYATAADAQGGSASSEAAKTQEVDFNLDLNLDNEHLDLDLSADSTAGDVPQVTLDMDLDLSLPLTYPMYIGPTDTEVSAHDNLIDFDMPASAQQPKPDDKKPG